MPPRELHGQAELQGQLGLPGGAGAGQLGEAVGGQAAAEKPVEHGAAQAQAPGPCGTALGLLVQMPRWERRGAAGGVRHHVVEGQVTSVTSGVGAGCHGQGGGGPGQEASRGSVLWHR